MTEVPIRIGVIGLGAFGRHHARHYAAHGSATLGAVADVDAGRAGEVATQHGCAGFADWREMIGKVDAVSIATPASTHAAIARDFVDAGVHVLIEKPIATTSGDADELIAHAEKAGVVLQVGHVERFSPAIDELVARVKDPRRISCVRRATWNGRSTDVDVVLDMMIHDIGHVLMVTGSPPVSVSASGRVGRSGATDEAEAWLTFAGGLIATLSASRVADRSERKLSVAEPGATYTADLAAPSLTVASRATWEAPGTPVALPPRDNLAAEIDAFLDSIATGAPPVVDGRAGLAALEVAERIQAAIADSDVPAIRSHAG